MSYKLKDVVRRLNWSAPGIVEAIRDQAECDICGRIADDRRHALDHDHRTGELRGVLCSRCNMGLGYFRDDLTALRNAADYLDRWRRFYRDCCPQCDAINQPEAKALSRDGLVMTYICTGCEHMWDCYWCKDAPYVL